MNHEMTLRANHDVVILDCSCGETAFSRHYSSGGMRTMQLNIPYSEISLAAMEHLRPEADQIIRDLLKKISVKDIIREILRRRS